MAHASRDSRGTDMSNGSMSKLRELEPQGAKSDAMEYWKLTCIIG